MRLAGLLLAHLNRVRSTAPLERLVKVVVRMLDDDLARILDIVARFKETGAGMLVCAFFRNVDNFLYF